MGFLGRLAVFFLVFSFTSSPSQSFAAPKKKNFNFAGRYSVSTRLLKIVSSNPRFECNNEWGESWEWKVSQKGKAITLTAPATITMRGRVTGQKKFKTSYGWSRPDPDYTTSHKEHYWVEEVYTFSSANSGKMTQTRSFNVWRPDWEQNNGALTEYECTSYFTGKFRRK